MGRVGVVVEVVGVARLRVQAGVHVPDEQTVAARLRVDGRHERCVVVAGRALVLDHEVLLEGARGVHPGHEHQGVRVRAGSAERDVPVARAHDLRREPAQHPLAEDVVIALVVVHHVQPAHAAVRPGARLVVVVVRQAQGVARLVDGDQGVVGPGVRVAAPAVFVLPLPGVGAQVLAAHGEGAVVERGLIAPPEARPARVGPRPDDDDVVDGVGGVLVVVVLGRVPARVGLRVGAHGLLDERLAPGVCGGDRAARLPGVIPGQHVALDVELAVGGARIVVVQALVGVRLRVAGVARAEEARLELLLGRVPGVVAEADGHHEHVHRARGGHAPPGGRRQGEGGGRAELGTPRALHRRTQHAGDETVVAQAACPRQARRQRAVGAVAGQLAGARRLQRQGRAGEQPEQRHGGGRRDDDARESQTPPFGPPVSLIDDGVAQVKGFTVRRAACPPGATPLRAARLCAGREPS